MTKDAVSILVVDKGQEVRDLLRDQFEHFDVALANPGSAAQEILSEEQKACWPDIVVVTQPASLGAVDLEHMLGAPGLLEKVSVVVFPTLTLPQSPAVVCRLQTISNLLQVVRGLAQKKRPQPLRAV